MGSDDCSEFVYVVTTAIIYCSVGSDDCGSGRERGSGRDVLNYLGAIPVMWRTIFYFSFIQVHFIFC